jgi:hypothetical protein
MAFEWTPAKENALYESWWTSIYYPQKEQQIRKLYKPGNKYINRNLEQVQGMKYGSQQGVKDQFSDPLQWKQYLSSYLQTQVQEAQRQAETEKAAQQVAIAKAEQDYAAAAKQAEESQIQANRISAVADYQGQQLTQQARQTSALAMQSQVQPVQTRKKTQIGQPGVSRTRVSSGIGIGGYGGTSAGNVNPTGLNI